MALLLFAAQCFYWVFFGGGAGWDEAANKSQDDADYNEDSSTDWVERGG